MDKAIDADGEVRLSATARAFGAENRSRLLGLYFADPETPVTAENAWQHVYRLLLWIDQTIALAHCYESDKAQPGRKWYARSLLFHEWVARELGTEPAALGASIDWLFREAVRDLAGRAIASRDAAYKRQRASYEGRGFPEPGDHPELMAIVKETLGAYVVKQPPPDIQRRLARRIYASVSQENKRKNLVGEGFEDVIAAIVSRMPFASRLTIRNRCLLHDLPGFHAPPENAKPKKVDLALIKGDARALVTAKWSIRADREEQFPSDFDVYARLESAGRDFQYVLITNEFDAARLSAACERRRENAPLFSRVVHIKPDAVLAAYSDETVKRVREHVRSGRLMSLKAWLEELGG
jgi:hypothetical protein